MNSRCDQSYTADGGARVLNSPAGVAVGATCYPPGPGDTQHSPSSCGDSLVAHDVHWRCNTGKNSRLPNDQFFCPLEFSKLASWPPTTIQSMRNAKAKSLTISDFDTVP